jgi:hypothetical protein
MTRPDHAFAYSELSKYVQCPQPAHILVSQHVLRYLRGTYELDIQYHHDSFHPDQLWGWVDADWEGDIETRHSHTGYVLIVYMCAILRDFGVTQTQPTLVYEDNLVCIVMSVNPVHRKYSRHIDIRRHYSHQLCLGNLVKLVPLCTNLVVADTLTKSLPTSGLERHRSVMMGHSDFQVRLLHTVRVG